jgi:hypothetical protein
MRKFAIIGMLAAVVAVVSVSLVTASYKTSDATVSAVDPTHITLNAGVLPVMQVNEPF